MNLAMDVYDKTNVEDRTAPLSVVAAELAEVGIRLVSNGINAAEEA